MLAYLYYYITQKTIRHPSEFLQWHYVGLTFTSSLPKESDAEELWSFGPSNVLISSSVIFWSPKCAPLSISLLYLLLNFHMDGLVAQ